MDELILTLRNSTAFWIDFLGSNSPVSPDDIDFYLIQVSEDTPFPSWEGQEDPQFSLYRNITFPRNSTMDTNRGNTLLYAAAVLLPMLTVSSIHVS